MNSSKKPPKQALRFLRWFCRDDYLEEIEGNLLEMYEKQQAHAPRWAKWQFVIRVLFHFRPAFIRSTKGIYQTNHYDMFKSYFTIAFRNLVGKKFYSTINIMGLSIGMICCMLIFLYVSHELSYDRFHTQADRIYRVVTDVKTPTETMNVGVTSAPMAASMKADFPEVEEMVRLDAASFLLQKGDLAFQEDEGMYADASFFKGV